MTYQVIKLGGPAKRWGVSDGKSTVIQQLTFMKARRRAEGLNRKIMDKTGRCLTRKERDFKEKKEVEET